MRRALFIAILLLPFQAHAQTAEPSPDAAPEMVLIPRVAAEGAARAMQAIAVLHPDLATPVVVQTFGMLSACLASNPSRGVLVRVGADQCPSVTAALAAQAKSAAPKDGGAKVP